MFCQKTIRPLCGRIVYAPLKRTLANACDAVPIVTLIKLSQPENARIVQDQTKYEERYNAPVQSV